MSNAAAVGSGSGIAAIAALLLAAATVLGALGAHGLQARLTPERLAVYRTAVDYHFFHALGLLAIGLAGRSVPLLRVSAGLLLAGIVLFCGSLYALSFDAPRVLGRVAPLGGLALIIGWAVLAVGLWRARAPGR